MKTKCHNKLFVGYLFTYKRCGRMNSAQTGMGSSLRLSGENNSEKEAIL